MPGENDLGKKLHVIICFHSCQSIAVFMTMSVSHIKHNPTELMYKRGRLLQLFLGNSFRISPFRKVQFVATDLLASTHFFSIKLQKLLHWDLGQWLQCSTNISDQLLLYQDPVCPSQVLVEDFPLCTSCSTQEIPQEHRDWQSTLGISSDLHNCLITPQPSTISFSPTLSLTVSEETLFPSQCHRRSDLFWNFLESQVEKNPQPQENYIKCWWITIFLVPEAAYPHPPVWIIFYFQHSTREIPPSPSVGGYFQKVQFFWQLK